MVTAGNLSNLPKTAMVKFTVLTNNTVWEPVTAKRRPHMETKMGLRLDLIKDNPKSVIETWQSIRKELMPRMANVDAVSAVELFEAHLTGPATREYAQILYDYAAKLYLDIDALFNKRFAKWTITGNAKSVLKELQKNLRMQRRSKNGQPKKTGGWTAERIDLWQFTPGPTNWNHSSCLLKKVSLA